MKLVDDASSAWRWYSMWAMGLSSGLIASWLAIPLEWQQIVLQNVPPKWMAAGVVVVLLLGMVGRIVDQPGAGDV